MSDEILDLQQQKKNGFTPREIFLKYMRFLPWVILSLSLMLLLAYAKLRYSTPIFSVKAKLLVKNPSPTSGAGEKFDDIFMMQSGRNNISDEIDVIKSRLMAKRVITKLGFQTQYSNKGQLRSSAIHPNDMPFVAESKTSGDSTFGRGIFIKVMNENEFLVGDPAVKFNFDTWFDYGGNRWILKKTGKKFSSFASQEFVITWTPLEDLADGLSGAIKVVRNDNYTSILSLSFETENPLIGKDVLNQYMNEYQQYNLEDKRLVALNTLEFIDEQLDTVRTELGQVEMTSKEFREKNKVIDPDEQAKMHLENISQSERMITDQAVKLKVAEQLIKYINDEKNTFKLVPTTLGIAEPSLIQQISEFNKLIITRETSLTTVPRANPIIVGQEAAIEKLRSDISDNLNNIRKTYTVAINDFSKNSLLSEMEVVKVPGIQKRLLEINRQQNILEELYSYLLKKKLETSIGSASTISNIRVVEPAFDSTIPIKPDRKSTYLLAVFIGLAIPIGIIFLLEYLNDRVQTKRDVEKMTDVPILGEVGHSDSSDTLVVGKNNRKVVAEQFRMIRTNLQFILHDSKKKVVMLTSSFSGEGKSFVSTNIAGVIALTGKKTVILEFDIRKPKIIQGLGMKRMNGMTNYIVGSCELKDLPQPVTGHENLYVIACGPVPPNPAELLLDPKIAAIFEFARNNFDFVVVDTAPVGLVSDAITLGHFADATVYIVRHDYTQKRQLQLVQDLYKASKLPSMSVVINDIKIKLGYGGYYGYGGYGYGYGYGYGRRSATYNDAAAYYGGEEKRKSKWRASIKRLFKK